MKIALISDIHGNRWALDEVLAHAAGQQVDAVWNLGDILSGPLDAGGTAERLMALGLLTISGNHERQLLACADGPGLRSDEHAFRHTTEGQRGWLRDLPATARPRPDVLLCHGTPGSDLETLMETHERIGGSRMATYEETTGRLTEVLAGTGGLVPPRLIACGHTHVPRVMQVSADCLVVNPGSVGLQAFSYEVDSQTYYVENGTPHASYAIVHEVEVAAPAGGTGRWQVTLYRVPYDWETAARLAEDNDRPEWAHALRTGFALRTLD
jgi:predicted phosphodiesterase